MTHDEVIAELTQAGITPQKGEYYDFKDFPLENEFAAFHEFGQTYLLEKNFPEEAKPARLFFNTNRSNNAGAWNAEGYGLIEIFRGSIFWMHEYCISKDALFNSESLKALIPITQSKNISPGRYMFQMLTIFYLYHEAGHLIQRRKDKLAYMEYIEEELSAEDIATRHGREHDADWHATTCLAAHIYQFCEEETDEAIFLHRDRLIATLPLALASIYLYFIYRMNAKPDIYYAEQTHPHPSVRLAYMIIYLLENLKVELPQGTDAGSLLKSAIQISDELMSDQEQNNVMSYSEAMYSQMDDIEKYINVLRKTSENDPTSCINFYMK